MRITVEFNHQERRVIENLIDRKIKNVHKDNNVTSIDVRSIGTANYKAEVHIMDDLFCDVVETASNFIHNLMGLCASLKPSMERIEKKYFKETKQKQHHVVSEFPVVVEQFDTNTLPTNFINENVERRFYRLLTNVLKRISDNTDTWVRMVGKFDFTEFNNGQEFSFKNSFLTVAVSYGAINVYNNSTKALIAKEYFGKDEYKEIVRG